MIVTTLVPTEQASVELYLNYPFIARFIEKSRGRYEFSDFEKWVEGGKMSIWLAYDDETGERVGICGVMIDDMAKVRICRIQLLAGEIGRGWDWVPPMMDMIESYARDMNCDKLENYGRPGWRRMSKRYGWKEVFSLSEKDL